MKKNCANQLQAGTVINHYTIESLVEQNAYGDVYLVKSDFSESKYSLKVGHDSSNQKELDNEYQILSKIQGSPYFPYLIDHGQMKAYKYNVLEIFGPTLSSLKNMLPDSINSPYCATLFAIKMLQAIKELHQKGIIHRDINPNNFVLRSNLKYPLVLINYGTADQYLDENSNHIQFDDGCKFVGTYKYSSLNVMKGETPSRRDDLISWYYSVVELYTGRLPWASSKDKDKILNIKESISPLKLIKNMPKEFLTLYTKLSILQFSDEPPYNEILSLLKKLKSQIPKTGQSKYDWNYLKKENIEKISPIGMIQMVDEELSKPQFPPQDEPKKEKRKKNNKECIIC